MRAGLAIVTCATGTPAFAWKPLTHADQARKAISTLPADHPLRPVLAEHRQYVYAGSVGPDLYYALFPEADTVLSDIAHYCRTDKLAASILTGAAGNPRLVAFAHGWMSHNVADAAAHPWVNGFVGAPFHGSIWRALIPGTDNNVHGVIEAWVNAQFTGGTDRAEFTRAMRLFATDVELQKVLGAAFEATYGDLYRGRVCQNGEWEDREGFKFPQIRRINVEQATRDAGGILASKWTWGAFADGGDFPLWLIPHLPSIGETAPDYLGLTRAYVGAAWLDGKAPRGFNLDIGINAAAAALEDVYEVPTDPSLRRSNVFPTPGTRYVAGGAKPGFIDRCEETEPKVCMTGPGGDWPDDNVSAAVPVAAGTATEPPRGPGREAMFWRLALKKGAAWPIEAARLHALAPAVNAAADAGDREALASAHAQVAEIVRRGSEASPVFAALYAGHGPPDARPFYATSDVLLLRKGYMGQATNVIEDGAREPTLWTQPEALHAGLRADHPVLVVPSGGLHGLPDAATFKAQLASYVAAGGTAIVFSQQRGSDYAVLPTPAGRPIGAWGWSEDNSCYFDAAYVETFHPLLASQSRALVTSAIDGFFDSIPEGSTVLLRRVKNGLPAMFLYAYGAGRVIVTSSYDDWGGFNQSSAGARAIIRDAIAWAKRPEDLPLHAPGANAGVTLQVSNHGPVNAAQVKLTLLSPPRDRVIDEIVVPLSVPANGSATVDYAHTFAAGTELGIYHVDYELLDASGVTVQPPAESDDGRIVVARPPPSPYRPRDLGLSIVMPAGEEFVVGGEAQFRYRLVNRAAVERRLRVYWDINHSFGVLVDELTLAPNAAFERDLSVPTPFLVGGGRFWVHVFEEGGVVHPRLPLVHVPNESAAYQLSDSKGFRALPAATGVTVTLDRAQYAPGDVMTATLALKNLTPLSWSGSLRVLGPSGAVVTELPMSFEVNGATTLAVDVTLPVTRPVPGSGPTYSAEVVRAGRVVGSRTWSVMVVAPVLRSAALDVPAWSRVSLNQVMWTLTNPGSAPATGEARASLVAGSGAVLWSGTQVFQVSAQDQAAVVWTLPALTEPEAGEAVLRLVADDGTGRPLVVTREVRSRLLASVASLSGLGAGDTATVRVTLANEGTYREEGELRAEIDGVGLVGPTPYDVALGEKVEVALPLTIPLDVRGGLHRGRVRLSSQATAIEFTLGVRVPRLALTLPEQSYAAGDTLPFVLSNDGGAASTALVDLRLRRPDGGSVVSRTESISVARDGEAALALVLPAQFPSGTYRLEALADDTRHGVQARVQRELTIAGAGATVTIETDRDAYAAGAPMTVTTRATNVGVALEDAIWRVEVVRACGDPVGNGGDFSALAGAAALSQAGHCGVVWERESSVELAPVQTREQSHALDAPAEVGAYLGRASLVTTDGHVLTSVARAFSVRTTDVALGVATDRGLYTPSEPVAISGVMRNDEAGAETGLRLRVELQADDRAALVLDEGVTLAPGETRTFGASVIPATRALFGDIRVVAELTRDDTTVARAVAALRTGEPALTALLRAPAPGVRVVPTSARLVTAQAEELDARLAPSETWLDGTLPFAVMLPGDFEDVTFDRFRLFAGGFVELVPAGAEALAEGATCLHEVRSDVSLLAPALVGFDATAGSVGFKLFAAGSRDDEGREFADDTLVFFWDAPLVSEPGGVRRRAQVLIARDGLLRLDADAVPPNAPGCARRGVHLPFTPAQAIESDGARLERGVGRGGFEVEAVVGNDGTYPATLDIDFGRVDGDRHVEGVALEPGERRVLRQSDTQPGAYSLLLSGDAQFETTREVVQSESLRIEYAGEETLRAGFASLPVRVVKRGGVGGATTVTYRLAGVGPEQTRTRVYDLEPGVWTLDALDFDVAEGAPLSLTVEAEGIAFEGFDVELRAGPRERVTLAAAAGAPVAGVLPVALDLWNTGVGDVTGELLLEGPGGSRADLTLVAGESRHVDVSVPLEGIVPGPQTYVARFVNGAGVTLATTVFDVTVQAPQVDLVATPEGQTYDAGTVAPFAFRLRNTGDQAARGTLRFEIFDRQVEAPFTVAPGAAVEVGFPLSIEDDVETKRVAGRYVLALDGGEPVAGQVNVTLRGATLQVEAALDREAYADGDTAHVTLHVTNGHPSAGSEYVARVRYGVFDEQRPFSVTDEATLAFDVPLPRVTGELLFIGITHPDGRSLVIDTRHVRRADALLGLTLDRQVYEPGATLVLTAAPAEPGTLTLDAPGYAETMAVSAPVTRAVTLPVDLIGGTQQVSWTFTAASGASAAGETPFDAAGLRVRVLAADLDRGRYASGDTLTSMLRVTTNEAATVTLRAFAVDPDESSELIGETTLALDPDEDLIATHAWPFATTVAGLYRFVYGLYRGEALLASGSVAFDVGAAAVLSVRTTQAEYASPDAEVEVVVTAFVSAPATLRLEVDGETALTREVTATGLVTLPLTLPGVAPGSHRLDAVLAAEGLTSRRTAFFALGTSLPDLVASPASARHVQGAQWSLDLDVSNVGRGVAGTTALRLRDGVTGVTIGDVTVPALDAGAAARVVVPWDVSGLAGERRVEAVVDAGAVVGEFREDNNVTPSSVSLPALVADIEAAASVPANVEAALGVTLTNLSADATQAGLTRALALTRPDGSAVAFDTLPVPDLGPGASVTVTALWTVGRAAPGVYGLDAQVRDAGGAVRASATAALDVQATIALDGSVSASPSPAQAGQPLTFAGAVTNAGNVALDGEAWFELLAADGTLATRATTPVSVPLDGAVAVEATTPALDVAPGDYALDLRVAADGHEHPVAASSLRVEGERVEVALAGDASPRVLAFIGGAASDAAGRARRNAFVDAALLPGGSLMARTSDALDFARGMRSGRFNTHVAFTEHALLLPLLADELREAVVRGDGLLLAQWGAGATPALDEALGARVTGVRPGTTHALTLQASPLGPARSLIVSSAASRLTLDGATAVGTFGAQPALTLHALGAGDAAVFAFDPAVPATDPARASLEELFAAAVSHVAPDQAREARAGTVMPLAFTLENPTSSERRVEVNVTLPAGVSVVSADDGAVAVDPPAWDVTVGLGETRRLRWAVALPDAAGEVVIASSVRVDGVLQAAPPAVTLTVPATTAATLANVIAALEVLPAGPGEHGPRASALAALRAAQAAPTTPVGLELRIRLAAEAAERIGRLTHASAPALRREVAYLIAAWERASVTP